MSRFFVGQWGNDVSCDEPDATMYALVHGPEHYGAEPELRGRRTWFRDCSEVWQFGSEYYGNIKVSTRGLCAALAQSDELFLHGCALRAGPYGLVLSGTSGSGKSTLTAALRASGAFPFEIVNDDWGVVSLSDGTMYYTGERRLHMKYRSVALLRPDLRPHPSRYATENYDGDPECAHGRLLIPRADVFGDDGVADVGILTAYVIVFRDLAHPRAIRPGRREDLLRVQEGEYSAFYERHERFLDGSLFLTSAMDVARHRAKLERLMETASAWVVNNVGSPSDTARATLEAIRGGR